MDQDTQPLLRERRPISRAPSKLIIAATIAVVGIVVFSGLVFFPRSPNPKSVLKELEAKRLRWGVPGIAVIAVKDFGDTILLSDGLGVRNEYGDPVTSKSLFQIGSTTKAMGAFVILKLAEKGIIDLTKHIKDIHPAFKMHDPSATALATLTDLLSHRTGLPRTDILLLKTNATIHLLDTKLSYLKPSYEFRAGFTYQNQMHTLAGAVAADLYLNRTSRGPHANFDGWCDMMDKELFEPLGMEHTSGDIRKWLDSPHRSDSARPVSFDPVTGIPSSKPGWLNPIASLWNAWDAPAGSVTTNIEDLAKYLRFVLKQGVNSKGERVLSTQAFANAFAPHNPYVGDFMAYPPAHLLPHYGLGWGVRTERGKTTVSHSGGTEMSCAVCLYADDGFGVFVLTNNVAGYGSAACQLVADRLLFKDSKTDPFADMEKLMAERINKQIEEAKRAFESRPRPVPLPSVDPSSFLGTYTNPLFGKVLISETELEFFAARRTSLSLNRLSLDANFVPPMIHHKTLEIATQDAADVPLLTLTFMELEYETFLKSNGLEETIGELPLLHFTGDRYALLGDPAEKIEFVSVEGGGMEMRVASPALGHFTWTKVV